MDNNSEVVYLHLDDIIPNRFQPREVFDEQALKELAVSIKEHGVIQPIIVRKVDNKYEIIAGERRYKASTMAGLNKIPAIIKNLDDKESSKVALIENLQRRDLTPIEEARTYQKILELEDEMTQEELAATMGKTQSSVSNKLRLLALPDEIQDALLNEKISERHARCLLNLEDANEQVKMLDRIIAEKLTVRELDRIIKEGKQGPSNSSSGGEPVGVTETANVAQAPIAPAGPVIKGFPVVNNDPVPAEDPIAPVDEAVDAVEPVQAEVSVDAAPLVQEADPAPQDVAPLQNPEPIPEVPATASDIEPEGYDPALEEAIQQNNEADATSQNLTPPEYNFDFDSITNPFDKHAEAPEPMTDATAPVQDSNVASAVTEAGVISEPIKDYGAVSGDIDALITTLTSKGFNAYYNENNLDNKIEYVITVEK